jgi:large subunit ribosomal protein L29
MKAKDLRDRSTEDLRELERSLAEERFTGRFKNFTNRLDDTSVIRKNRRDLARVKLILTERALGITPGKSEASTNGEAAPKPKPPQRKRAAAPEATAVEPTAKKIAKKAGETAPAAKADKADPAETEAPSDKAAPKRSTKAKAKPAEKTESK